MQKRFGIAVVAALLATPFAAQAQGVVGGAQRGAAEGNAAAGPVGAVVGGAVGAVTGGVSGLLGVDQSRRFNDYAIHEHRSSYRFDQQLRPGVRLPLSGITYYQVPPEYGVDPRLRYTMVNDHAVLVDPATRQIVQIID